MFDAFVVSVVADVARPVILDVAIAALAFISALTISPSLMPSSKIFVNVLI
jgi:hypothetical protein